MKNDFIKKIYAVWIYVEDLKISRKFYENIIGLKVKFQQRTWVEFDLGETSFALLERHKGDALKPQKTRIMFEVEAIEVFKKRLEQNKVKIIKDVREESYGKIFTFEDPNGHWLEVFEKK